MVVAWQIFFSLFRFQELRRNLLGNDDLLIRDMDSCGMGRSGMGCVCLCLLPVSVGRWGNSGSRGGRGGGKN